VNDDEQRPRRRGRPAVASRVMLAVAGVTALTVALLASGCTTVRAPAAGTGSATMTARATIATATVPAATSTPTATAPVSVSGTRVETFDPWTAAGTLPPGVKVLGRYSGGRCTMRSSFDAGNRYAWRCFLASGAFYDPCFAPAARSGVTQVACVDSPWSGASIIRLARPLARSSWGTPGSSQAKYPWAMVLGNGQECGLIEGTAPLADGVALSFGCTDGYSSFPRTGTRPWTAGYATSSSGPVTPIAVTTAFA
jgi:hypothetical protein